MRRPLIAGNWKMNGLLADGTERARALAERARKGAPRCDLLLCPPATLLQAVRATVDRSGIAVGGQDCHAADKGAHTGDLSAAMLKDLGCSHVIVGHSERRSDHRESDGCVRAKVEAAWRHGLVAILCVGESEAQREAGEALEVVAGQLAGSIPQGAGADRLVVAYEPVWAIGTGRTATPHDVQAMHAHIREASAGRVDDAAGLRILYGGSVKPDNASALLALEDVDGALVGGASLDADAFWAIAASCP